MSAQRVGLFEATEAHYRDQAADLCRRAGVDPADLAAQLDACRIAAHRIRVYRDLDLKASSNRRQGDKATTLEAGQATGPSTSGGPNRGD